jgi:hypothetical protein
VSGTQFNSFGSDIQWLNNSWVAVGSDATNYYIGSVDGNIWTGLGKGTNTVSVFGIGGYAYINKANYVLIGSGAVLFTSYDGINLIRRPSTNLGNNSLTVAFGKDSSGNDLWATGSTLNLSTSYDGITWVARGTNARQIVYANNMWMASASSGSSIRRSFNGLTWTSVVTPITTVVCVGWNGSYWVIGGQTGNTFATSYNNGASWIGRGQTALMTICRCIVWGNGLWVAGGGNGIAISPDSVTWTLVASGLAIDVRCIGWNGSIFVAGCNNSIVTDFSIITSTDGIVWTGRSKTAIGIPPTNVI